MIKVSAVAASIVLGLLARSIEFALPTLGINSAANVFNISGIFQYAVMFGLGMIALRRANIGVWEVFGTQLQRSHLLVGISTGLLLIMLTLGVSTLIVLGVAQFSPDFAYRFWHFHSAAYYVSMPMSAYAIMVVAQFLCAPIVEEFMFRGLLFKACTRYGITNATLIVAFTFTLLHYSSHLWLTTFVFSLALSILYLAYRSLWVCIVAHCVNNITAFVIEYYYDFHWTRQASQLDNVVYWIPELLLLVVSLSILVVFGHKCLRQIKSSAAAKPSS